MSKLLPYRLSFPRTAEWYNPGGTWYQISTWCYESIGNNKDWEYYGGVFLFKEEQYKTMFLLRWGSLLQK